MQDNATQRAQDALFPDLAGLAERGPAGRPTSPANGARHETHGQDDQPTPAAPHDGPAARVGLAERMTDEKPCSTCGQMKSVSEFNRDKYRCDGLASQCRACARERLRKARQEQPEQAAEYNQRWYRANADAKRAYQRNRRSTKPGEVRESTRKWRELHSEHERSYRLARYWANPEKFRSRVKVSRDRYHDKTLARVKAWQKANPDKAKAIQHAANVRRKAREKNAPGRFSFREWETLKARYGHICLCCGRQEPEVKLTPDHVIPLAHGGSNGIENIQPLCLNYNVRKQARMIDYRPEARAESEVRP